MNFSSCCISLFSFVHCQYRATITKNIISFLFLLICRRVKTRKNKREQERARKNKREQERTRVDLFFLRSISFFICSFSFSLPLDLFSREMNVGEIVLFLLVAALAVYGNTTDAPVAQLHLFFPSMWLAIAFVAPLVFYLTAPK